MDYKGVYFLKKDPYLDRFYIKVGNEEVIRGETGDTGPEGSQGPKGDTGPEGPQGPRGDTGADGDTGLEGPKGDTGDTGADGEPGPGSEANLTLATMRFREAEETSSDTSPPYVFISNFQAAIRESIGEVTGLVKYIENPVITSGGEVTYNVCIGGNKIIDEEILAESNFTTEPVEILVDIQPLQPPEYIPMQVYTDPLPSQLYLTPFEVEQSLESIIGCNNITYTTQGSLKINIRLDLVISFPGTEEIIIYPPIIYLIYSVNRIITGSSTSYLEQVIYNSIVDIASDIKDYGVDYAEVIEQHPFLAFVPLLVNPNTPFTLAGFKGMYINSIDANFISCVVCNDNSLPQPSAPTASITPDTITIDTGLLSTIDNAISSLAVTVGSTRYSKEDLTITLVTGGNYIVSIPGPFMPGTYPISLLLNGRLFDLGSLILV